MKTNWIKFISSLMMLDSAVKQTKKNHVHHYRKTRIMRV